MPLSELRTLVANILIEWTITAARLHPSGINIVAHRQPDIVRRSKETDFHALFASAATAAKKHGQINNCPSETILATNPSGPDCKNPRIWSLNGLIDVDLMTA